MILSRKYNLPISHQDSPLIIRYSRGASSSRLSFSLQAGYGVLNISPVQAYRTVLLLSTSETHTPFGVVGKVNWSKNQPFLDFVIPPEATKELGLTKCEIVLIVKGVMYRLVTAPFFLDIL